MSGHPTKHPSCTHDSGIEYVGMCAKCVAYNHAPATPKQAAEAILRALADSSRPTPTIFDPIPCGHAAKLGAILSREEECAWCLNLALTAKLTVAEHTITKLREELKEAR